MNFLVDNVVSWGLGLAFISLIGSLIGIMLGNRDRPRSTLRHTLFSPMTYLWLLPWWLLLMGTLSAPRVFNVDANTTLAGVMVCMFFIATGIIGFAGHFVTRRVVEYENHWKWYGANVVTKEVHLIPGFYCRVVKQNFGGKRRNADAGANSGAAAAEVVASS